MKTAIIIPARLGSTRLPRKPLRMIVGMTLIERVYWQCKKAAGIDKVLIATDSDEIIKHVKSFGGEAVMTPEDCANGTERVGYAARHLTEDVECIINVQGDEPLVEPEVVEALVKAFEDKKVEIATPITAISEIADVRNEHIVKVVTDVHNDILYFSRAAIPYDRNFPTYRSYWRHAGLYAFRRNTLEAIRHLPKTELEETESLEQLRWLYHGYKIRAVRVENKSIEVNTEEDLQKVENILTNK